MVRSGIEVVLKPKCRGLPDWILKVFNEPADNESAEVVNRTSENKTTKAMVNTGIKAKVPNQVRVRVVQMKIMVRKVGRSPTEIGTNLPRVGVPDQIGKDRKEV